MNVRFSLGLRIYSIIGLSFCGLIGLAVLQINTLASSQKEQRQNELSHLSQLALSIAREEYDAAARDHSSEDLARKTAAARISKLRYRNGDYFWINDLGPRMIMHPLKPELNGQDLTDNKDPNGKRLFVESSDVDRRISSRVDIRLPAKLIVQGKSASVIVRDLSLGGAMIDETFPNVSVDTAIKLVINGIAAELDGFVARKDADATLMKFNLSEVAEKIVSEWVSTRLAA